MPQQHPFLNNSNSLTKPLVGISACLCGDHVRYDGHTKGHPALIAALEPYLNLQKICPEVAIGMGTPRDPIQLSKESGEIRAIGIKNPDYDVTSALKKYARDLFPVSLITTPESMPLCGYIFKSRSPSCGVGSTPIHENNIATGFGDGVFAQQIQQQQPWLPVAEEQGLADSTQQQHFVMLAQLAALFFKTLESNKPQEFQNKTEKLRAQLPQTIQNRLIELTSSNDPRHYLTLLIKELQQTAYTGIKSML
ncbi:MAG: DUF523 domain-containing protein [Pseudomonadales bacterium]